MSGKSTTKPGTTDEFETTLRVLAEKYNLYPYFTSDGEWIMSNGLFVDARPQTYLGVPVAHRIAGGRPNSLIAPQPTLRKAVACAVAALLDRRQQKASEARSTLNQTEQEMAVLIGLRP